jgi:hypothetical protein
MLDAAGVALMLDLVVLVVTACLASSPRVCDDHRIPLEEGISLRSCQIQGQIGLAQWAGEHPGLQIIRWRCETPATEKRAV